MQVMLVPALAVVAAVQSGEREFVLPRPTRGFVIPESGEWTVSDLIDELRESLAGRLRVHLNEAELRFPVITTFLGRKSIPVDEFYSAAEAMIRAQYLFWVLAPGGDALELHSLDGLSEEPGTVRPNVVDLEELDSLATHSSLLVQTDLPLEGLDPDLVLECTRQLLPDFGHRATASDEAITLVGDAFSLTNIGELLTDVANIENTGHIRSRSEAARVSFPTLRDPRFATEAVGAKNVLDLIGRFAEHFDLAVFIEQDSKGLAGVSALTSEMWKPEGRGFEDVLLDQGFGVKAWSLEDPVLLAVYNLHTGVIGSGVARSTYVPASELAQVKDHPAVIFMTALSVDPADFSTVFDELKKREDLVLCRKVMALGKRCLVLTGSGDFLFSCCNR